MNIMWVMRDFGSNSMAKTIKISEYIIYYCSTIVAIMSHKTDQVLTRDIH